MSSTEPDSRTFRRGRVGGAGLAGILRSLAFMLLWGLYLMVCGLRLRLWVQLPVHGRRRLDRWFSLRRDWARGVFWLAEHVCAMRLERQGELPPPGSYLIVSNHQSSADIILLLTVFSHLRCRFLAKRSLKWGIPIVSPTLRNMGDLPVEAEPERDVQAMIRFARRLVPDRASAIVFPEGVRTRDGGLGSFHRGGLRLLCREAGVPLVPVAIDGLWRARSLGRYLRYLPHAKVKLWVGEPIPWQSLRQDARGSIDAVERQIGRVLEAWRATSAAPEASEAGTLGVEE